MRTGERSFASELDKWATGDGDFDSFWGGDNNDAELNDDLEDDDDGCSQQ